MSNPTPPRARLSTDFWKFWTGETISSLGSAFSFFALPLLVFQLTHSALSLAVTTAVWAIPHLLFGLLAGALVDRTDRKRLMITLDILLALTMLAIPGLLAVHHLTVLSIYAIQFVSSTLTLVFEQAQFTAVPSVVGDADLVTANGRINATFQATGVLGPILAGGLVSVVPVADLVIVDAVSYLFSALALATVAVSFNRAEAGVVRPPTRILADIREGLAYVFHHPVLRNISLMMMLFNLINATTQAQEVLYAKDRLHASNLELGIYFAAGGTGGVIFSFLAGRLRRRFSFSQVVIGCLSLYGLSLLIFSMIPWFWLAVPVLMVTLGLGSLLNINTWSLRQAIVPNRMLGRVLSVAGVLAFSATPIGSVAGGYVISRTHNIALVFGVIGLLLFLVPLIFTRTALGHADRYLAPEGRRLADPEPAL